MTSDFWADQRHAAKRETQALFGRYHKVVGGQQELRDWGPISQRWRDELAANLEVGRLEACSHLDLAPEQPIWIMAHRLDRMLCQSCTALAQQAEYDPIEDNTCDGCQKYQADGIFPVAHQSGNIILSGGLCEQCKALDRV